MLEADGRVVKFMEQTDFHTMKPADHLAAGSAERVLAGPSGSYIAYTYECSAPMGVKGLTAGTYDLLWFDTASGATVRQTGVSTAPGDATWPKPNAVGGQDRGLGERNRVLPALSNRCRKEHRCGAGHDPRHAKNQCRQQHGSCPILEKPEPAKGRAARTVRLDQQRRGIDRRGWIAAT
jgi:hypothetical protein